MRQLRRYTTFGHNYRHRIVISVLTALIWSGCDRTKGPSDVESIIQQARDLERQGEQCSAAALLLDALDRFATEEAALLWNELARLQVDLDTEPVHCSIRDDVRRWQEAAQSGQQTTITIEVQNTLGWG